MSGAIGAGMMTVLSEPFIMTLQTLLGTELPVIQAPMAGVQGSPLALAVCRAGGLGSLPCAMLDAATLQREVAALRSGTDRPWNLNFFCHQNPAPPHAAAQADWLHVLAPYYRELGLDPATTQAAGASRAPFSHAVADLLEGLRPPVVSFHFGLPAPDLLARVKRWGSVVMSSATTAEEALWLEAHGADVIIAQGLEAGGHRGHFLGSDLSLQMGSFALLPQVVRAVRCPVVAAGGIADAAGVAAARALGAAGVQVGTAYLLCPEAQTSAVHRQALRSEAARHTALTTLFSGRPARGIVNRLMHELGPLHPAALPFPLAAAAVAPLRAQAESLGSGDFSPLWCGQNASGCSERPAGEITRDLASGYARTAELRARPG